MESLIALLTSLLVLDVLVVRLGADSRPLGDRPSPHLFR